MNAIEELKDQLREFITQGKYEKLFEDGEALLKAELIDMDQWFILKARYNKLREDIVKGRVSDKELKRKREDVTRGLLSFVEGVTAEAKKKKISIQDRILPTEITRLIAELSHRGSHATVHNADLTSFGDAAEDVLNFIRRFSILHSPDDIRRLLHWALTAMRDGKPLASINADQALALYRTVFDQPALLEKWQQSGEKINIVLFRRGKNGKKLTNLLKTLPFVNLQIVVSATDEGESWYYPARMLAAPGIPGIAKALVDLSEDASVKEFLETRIHITAPNSKALLSAEEAQDAMDILIDYLATPLPDVAIAPGLNVLYQRAMRIEVTKRKQIAAMLLRAGEAFRAVLKNGGQISYQGLAVRNLVLLGAVLTERMKGDLGTDPRAAAMSELADVLNIRPGCSVLLPNKKLHFLLALRKDGTLYFSEAAINHYVTEAPIIGLWVIEAIVDQDFIQNCSKTLREQGVETKVPIEDIELKEFDQELGRQIKETVLKVDPSAVDAAFHFLAEKSINYTGGKSVKESLLTEEVADAIIGADILITTNKRIETNSGGALLIPGMDHAILASKAVKIHLAMVSDEEGYERLPEQSLESTYRYLTNQHAHHQPTIEWTDVGRYFDYILVGANEKYLFERLAKSTQRIETQTDWITSAVLLDTSENGQYGFYGSTSLTSAIVALYECHLLGFKVGYGGGLIPIGFVQDKSVSSDSASMGIFRRSPDCMALVENLRRNLKKGHFLRYQGVFAFDVDMTILPKGAESLAMYPKLAYLFMRLLRQGVRVAIISGNSREHQIKRMQVPIAAEMHGERSAFERLVFYVDGGSTKIRFDQDGNPIDDEEYNSKHNLNIEDFKAIINPILKAAAKDHFGLSSTDVDSMIQLAQKKYAFKVRAPWRAQKDWEPVWVTPEEITNKSKEEELTFPWVEIRGQKDFNHCSAFAIKPLPILEHTDARLALQVELRKALADKGIFIGIGGSSTIDIASGKTNAMRDLIHTLQVKSAGSVYYFGDEFTEQEVVTKDASGEKRHLIRGNDLELALNDDIAINTVAVNPEKYDLKLDNTIWIGRGPQAVYELLESILIEEDECL